jgi:hypothetical protein
MELFLALIPVGGIALTILAVVVRARLHASRVLQDAAAELGLEVLRPAFGFPSLASGAIEDCQVRIMPATIRESDESNDPRSWTGRGGPGFSVLVSRLGRIPQDLRITSSSRSLLNLFQAREGTLTGDTGFDTPVTVRGPLPVVLALLDYSTRLSLITLVTDSRGSVEGGCIRLDSGPYGDGSSLAQAARFVSTIAVALSRPRSLPERLAANAREDLVHLVRGRNLEILLRTFPHSEEARTAAHHALSDPSPHVRLEGATFLGKEALDCLRRLATEEPMPEEVTAGALVSLAKNAPGEDTASLLLEYAKRRRGMVRTAAIEGLGILRLTSAIGTLSVILEEADSEAAGAAARALGGIDGAQPVLLSALRSRQTEALAAVVDVLGQTGTVDAVPLLSELARGWEVLSPLRQGARDAVRRIQVRAPGAGAGQLAIAEAPDPQGAVALVEDEAPRGRLALVEQPRSGPPTREDLGE